MYICINCGAECKELFRRYCPSVLKILKCVSEVLQIYMLTLTYQHYQFCIITTILGKVWLVS